MKKSKISLGTVFWVFTIPAMLLSLFFDSAHYPVFNTGIVISLAVCLIGWYKSISVKDVD